MFLFPFTICILIKSSNIIYMDYIDLLMSHHMETSFNIFNLFSHTRAATVSRLPSRRQFDPNKSRGTMQFSKLLSLAAACVGLASAKLTLDVASTGEYTIQLAGTSITLKSSDTMFGVSK